MKKGLFECGITKDISMYNLRHTYITNMVNDPRIPIKVVSEMVGHKSLQMIDTHYYHSDLRKNIEIMESLDKTPDKG